MTPRAVFRRTTRWSGACCKRGFRLLLVLSLWHAPIPWIHAHDVQGPDVDSRTLLSEHVAEFHARELAEGRQRLDWHAHLILPWCLVHHFPCPESQHSQRASDDLVGAIDASSRTASIDACGPALDRAFMAGLVVVDGAVTVLSAVAGDTGQAARECGGHFFASYGPSIGVQELIGLRLC